MKRIGIVKEMDNLGRIVIPSLTGIEPIWFEMENSLPYCVEKA